MYENYILSKKNIEHCVNQFGIYLHNTTLIFFVFISKINNICPHLRVFKRIFKESVDIFQSILYK